MRSEKQIREVLSQCDAPDPAADDQARLIALTIAEAMRWVLLLPSALDKQFPAHN